MEWFTSEKDDYTKTFHLTIQQKIERYNYVNPSIYSIIYRCRTYLKKNETDLTFFKQFFSYLCQNRGKSFTFGQPCLKPLSSSLSTFSTPYLPSAIAISQHI